MRTFLHHIFFLLYSLAVFAQSPVSIIGSVEGADGKPLSGATVFINKTNYFTQTDSRGHFELSATIGRGSYIITITHMGYENFEKHIDDSNGEVISLGVIDLKEDLHQLNAVEITSESVEEEKKISGYAVNIIETKQLKNATVNINQLLKTTPGINIRETGGLGSDFKLSLNGLSGNQIRYFIDGVPMENFGSALTLNNYPVNLIKSIEVYKGVVPVHLGADALGGAINIITGHRKKTFLDTSYSSGSFNTHKASMNAQLYSDSRDLYARFSSFFNHSDNSYLMKGVSIYDLKLGNYERKIDAKRFHDRYTSAMANLEVGLMDKRYADHFFLNLTAAKNRKQYQHPDNTISVIFGDFHTNSQTLLASVTYKKHFKNLNLKAYILTGQIIGNTIDLGKKKYNWLGDYINKDPNDANGELFEKRGFVRVTDGIINGNFNLGYDMGKSHNLTLNVTQNRLNRKTYRKIFLGNSMIFPNVINKTILGVLYSYKKEKMDVNLFGKKYLYRGKITTKATWADEEKEYVITQPKFDRLGYGISISYKPTEVFLVKGSFEKAYRTPESYEIMGDGIYINPNRNLNPERSLNANLGARFIKRYRDLSTYVETNCFYRFSKDFIRYKPSGGPFGRYQNINDVLTLGLEISGNFDYHKRISLNTNVTYQSLTDETEFDEGLKNVNYKSRIPNIPYFFANMRLGVKPFSPKRYDVSIYWHLRYVHNFFLTWENMGDISTKNVIPKQLIHDLEVDYSAKRGRYNISLSLTNIADALAYDNFNIQKPGRAVYLKFRYFLTKSRASQGKN